MSICIAGEKFKLTIIYWEQAIPGENFNQLLYTIKNY
jgi:hypothetical protein